MRRRLEDEPLLAARIVVEDCLNLLLDVDDIDRMWAASGAQRDNRAALCQRRSLLLKVGSLCSADSSLTAGTCFLYHNWQSALMLYVAFSELRAARLAAQEYAKQARR